MSKERIEELRVLIESEGCEDTCDLYWKEVRELEREIAPPRQMKDPTREEIEEVLANYALMQEADDFDKEEAIYCFASDWHGGQASNLYSVLCNSPFKPGLIWSYMDPRGASQMVYDYLEATFTEEA